MLIGNVGREPDIHYVNNGICTASLSLATSTPGYTLSGGTQVPERTEWHRILLWRRMAEIVEKYVHKGDTRYVTEIWAEKLELLTPKTTRRNTTESSIDAANIDSNQPPF